MEIDYNYIVIEGNIGVGKTTFCNLIYQKLNSVIITEEFEDNPFLPLFYKNQERYAFPVELFFMTERHKQLLEELVQPKLFKKRVLADYMFTKTILFAKNNLNEVEFNLFKRIYITLNSHFPQPDILLYFYRPTEELLKNIKKRNRTYEQQITPEYLESLHDAYMSYFKIEKSFPIVIINLGDKDFIEEKKYLKKIYKLLKKDHPVGISFVEL